MSLSVRLTKRSHETRRAPRARRRRRLLPERTSVLRRARVRRSVERGGHRVRRAHDLRPSHVERGVAQSVDAGPDDHRLRRRAAHVRHRSTVVHEQVEVGVLGAHGIDRPRVRDCVDVAAHEVGAEHAARSWRDERRPFAHVRHRGESSGAREAEPRSALFQIATAEDVRRVLPCVRGRRRSRVEFVAIRREDEDVLADVVREDDEAHRCLGIVS